MAKMVPLIGSSQAGPLGAIHLPRLWSKVLMSAKGVLDAEYDECGTGFDQMVLDGLGLDREQTLNYLKTDLPTYPQFEQWVLKQRALAWDSRSSTSRIRRLLTTCTRTRTSRRSRRRSA